MPILNDNIEIFANKPYENRSFYYGFRPYASVSEANTNIPFDYRYQGLTVYILNSGNIVEYWYRTGINNNDLVQKYYDFSSSLTLNDPNILATAKAIHDLNQLKLDKTGGVINGNLTLNGTFTLNGDVYQVSGEINAQDSVLRLNDGEVGSGVTLGFSGFEIDRGTPDNFWLGFDEVRQAPTAGFISDLTSIQIATTQVLAVRSDTLTDNSIVKWNNTLKRFEDSGHIYTELDNLAYNNINNNFSVGQTFQQNITAQWGTFNIGSGSAWNALRVRSSINNSGGITFGSDDTVMIGRSGSDAEFEIRLGGNSNGNKVWSVDQSGNSRQIGTLLASSLEAVDNLIIYQSSGDQTELIAESSSSDYSLILPAKNGTIATLSDLNNSGNLPNNIAYNDINNNFSAQVINDLLTINDDSVISLLSGHHLSLGSNIENFISASELGGSLKFVVNGNLLNNPSYIIQSDGNHVFNTGTITTYDHIYMSDGKFIYNDSKQLIGADVNGFYFAGSTINTGKIFYGASGTSVPHSFLGSGGVEIFSPLTVSSDINIGTSVYGNFPKIKFQHSGNTNGGWDIGYLNSDNNLEINSNESAVFGLSLGGIYKMQVNSSSTFIYNTLNPYTTLDDIFGIVVTNTSTGSSSATRLQLSSQGNDFQVISYGDNTSKPNITEFLSSVTNASFLFSKPTFFKNNTGLTEVTIESNSGAYTKYIETGNNGFKIGYDSDNDLFKLFAINSSSESLGIEINRSLSNNGLKYKSNIIYHSGNFLPDVDYVSASGGVSTGSMILNNTNSLTLSSTNHAFQIGLFNQQNLAFDQNSIQSRINGAISSLNLNEFGGTVFTNGYQVLNTNNLSTLIPNIAYRNQPNTFLGDQTFDGYLVTNYGIKITGKLADDVVMADGTTKKVNEFLAVVDNKHISYSESYINNYANKVARDAGFYYPNTASYEYAKLKTMKIHNKCGLLMIPSGVKENIIYSIKPFDEGKLSFQRSSTGMYFNEEGILKSAPNNFARIDYINNYPDFLFEKRTINLEENSNDFSNSLLGATVTPNSGISIDGTNNFSLIQSTTTSAYSGWNNSYNSVSTGVAYTFSCFVKYSNNSWIGLYHQGTGISYFNLETGVVGTDNLNLVVDDYENGVYRLSYTIIAVSGTNNFHIYNSNSNGNSSSDIGNRFLLYGVQFEAGYFATSYVPALGSISTRENDIFSINNLVSNNIIGLSEGGIFFDFNEYRLSLNGNDTSNRIEILPTLSSSTDDSIIIDDNQIIVRSSGSITHTETITNGKFKLFLSINGTNLDIYMNGIFRNSATISNINFNYINFETISKIRLTQFHVYKNKLDSSESQELTKI